MGFDFHDHFAPLRLRSGDGGDWKNGLCFMEAVSWIASEGATDQPECACPVLGKFGILLNDRLSDKNRQKLLPLVLAMAGTRSVEHELARAKYITLRVIREILPQAFDAIGLTDHATALREATDLPAVDAVADAAYAVDSAARAVDAGQRIYLECIPILEGAIHIGPNAASSADLYVPRAVELGQFAARELA